MTRKRVLVAMSGGVDSSVTAYLLSQQGYDCLGATMLLHGDAAPGACGSGSDADDAAAISARLGFPHERDRDNGLGTTPSWKSHRRVTVPIVTSKVPRLRSQYPKDRRMRSAVSGDTSTASGDAACARQISESQSVRDRRRSK